MRIFKLKKHERKNQGKIDLNEYIPLINFTRNDLKQLNITRLPVVNEKNENVGKITKLLVDKSGFIKFVQIVTPSNQLRQFNAGRFIVGKDKIILLDRLISPEEVELTSKHFETAEIKARRALDKEIGKWQKLIEKIDLLRKEGKISESHYKSLRETYQNKMKNLENAKSLIKDIYNRKMMFEEEEKKLLEKLQVLKIRLDIGELSQEEYRSEHQIITALLEKVRRKKEIADQIIKLYSELL